MVEQGDLIRIEGIKHTALVVSKNTFNESGRAVVCPVLKEDKKATLSYSVGDNQFVLCDNPRQLDIESRRYSVIQHSASSLRPSPNTSISILRLRILTLLSRLSCRVRSVCALTR